MTTITIWLLVSIGSFGTGVTAPTQVVERFATGEECQRVLGVLYESSGVYVKRHRCIQATVVRTKGGAE